MSGRHSRVFSWRPRSGLRSWSSTMGRPTDPGRSSRRSAMIAFGCSRGPARGLQQHSTRDCSHAAASSSCAAMPTIFTKPVEDLLALGPEPGEAVADHHRVVEADDRILGRLLLDLVGRYDPARRAQQVEAAIARQLADPGPDRLVGAERAEPLVDPREDVLEDILGVVLGAAGTPVSRSPRRSGRSARRARSMPPGRPCGSPRRAPRPTTSRSRSRPWPRSSECWLREASRRGSRGVSRRAPGAARRTAESSSRQRVGDHRRGRRDGRRPRRLVDQRDLAERGARAERADCWPLIVTAASPLETMKKLRPSVPSVAIAAPSSKWRSMTRPRAARGLVVEFGEEGDAPDEIC